MKGSVYKIIHTESNICYVGSTLQSCILKRWNYHKLRWIKNKSELGTIAIYPYFEKYGIENFKIILIKQYEVVDRRHLETKDCLLIAKLKSCNKNNPFSLPLNKHYMKIYREEKKEHIKNLNKQWKEDNKEYTCECETELRKEDKERHLRTKKHTKFVEDGIVIAYKIDRSKESGVSWVKSQNSWRVMLRVDGKKKFFGYFKEYNDAVSFAKQKKNETIKKLVI